MKFSGPLNIIYFTLCIFLCASLPAFTQNNVIDPDHTASSSKGSSIRELHNKLIKDKETDREKLHAFYFWIANNINYDVSEWTNPTNNWKKQEPANVLKSKKAVCHGYAELLKALCDLSNIKSYLVSGYIRRNNQFVSEGHTWNVVYLNNTWLPVDVTGGAGGVTNQRKFMKEYDEQYFLSDPVDFLQNHYPFDPAWQLVNYPVKLTEYKKQNWKYSPLPTENIYNFNDTLALWEKQESLAKRLMAAQRMIRMNPEDIESKKELSFAMFDAADAQSAKGINILSELYPKSQSQHSTAIRANIPKAEFNSKLDTALHYFNAADSILNKLVVYSQPERNNLANAKKAVRHNIEIIKSERGKP